MPTIDQIAKTINGPNDATHVGTTKLAELQDISWGQCKSQEQAVYLRAARYVQMLFEREDPDGWVILNGADDKVRGWQDGGTPWSTDLENALWFARRKDADRFCEEDEEAWHVRRVSDVRRMWAAPPAIAGGPPPSTGALRSSGYVENVVTPTGTVPPPQNATLPVDRRSLEDLLRLFRAFVMRNATQWVRDTGDHHHPMWSDLSCAITQEDATFGPDWAFIQPLNRKPHAILVEEYADQSNAFEAEKRGG